MNRIFNYDPRNGLLLSEGLADRNPEYERVQAEAAELRAHIETGLVDEERVKAMEAEPEFHYPAFCTTVEPPSAPDGYGAYWRGASWEVALLPAADGSPPAEEPTEEMKVAQRLKDAEDLVERHMESIAVGLGYKSLDRGISYADEPAVEKYQKEGQFLRAMRSRMWAWFYSDEVQAIVAADKFDVEAPGMPKLYPEEPDSTGA